MLLIVTIFLWWHYEWLAGRSRCLEDCVGRAAVNCCCTLLLWSVLLWVIYLVKIFHMWYMRLIFVLIRGEWNCYMGDVVLFFLPVLSYGGSISQRDGCCPCLIPVWCVGHVPYVCLPGGGVRVDSTYKIRICTFIPWYSIYSTQRRWGTSRFTNTVQNYAILPHPNWTTWLLPLFNVTTSCHLKSDFLIYKKKRNYISSVSRTINKRIHRAQNIYIFSTVFCTSRGQLCLVNC
jgi:hypothetical protein